MAVLGDLRGQAEAIGLTHADTVMATRTFLSVEGEHENVFLDRLIHRELEDNLVTVVPVRGTSDRELTGAAAEILLRLDEHFVVLLDDLDVGLEQRWRDLRSRPWDKATKKYLDEAFPADRVNVARRFFRSFAEQALRLGVGHKVELVALHHPDLVWLLPPEAFGLTSTWDELYREFKQSGTRSEFKPRVKDNRMPPGRRIGVNSIRAAVHQDELPPIVTRILEVVRVTEMRA
jgi:hypothetical protein